MTWRVLTLPAALALVLGALMLGGPAISQGQDEYGETGVFEDTGAYEDYGYYDDGYTDDDWFYDYYDNGAGTGYYDTGYGDEGYEEEYESAHWNWHGGYDDAAEEGLFDW